MYAVYSHDLTNSYPTTNLTGCTYKTSQLHSELHEFAKSRLVVPHSQSL